MIIEREHTIKDDEFKDKVILVTGANRGFGLAITMDLARAGATVIMLGRDLGSLESVSYTHLTLPTTPYV